MTRPTPEQIEAAIRVFPHPKLRDYCDPDHPSHDPRYYTKVIELAEGGALTPAVEPQLPSLAQRALNYGTAVVRHWITGQKEAPPEVAAARLDICHGVPPDRPRCDEFTGSSCRLCGCNMAVKVTWAEQACPVGKWGAVPENQTD